MAKFRINESDSNCNIFNASQFVVKFDKIFSQAVCISLLRSRYVPRGININQNRISGSKYTLSNFKYRQLERI